MPQDLVESFSGIRGIYGSSITEKLAKEYVFSYIDLFCGSVSRFVIGGDSRPSTQALKQAMIDALKRCGVKEIIDVGVIPIQAVEYAVLKFQADGGVCITASHNEPKYNGWKFLKQDGAILYAEQSEKLINTAHSPRERAAASSYTETKVLNKQKEAVEHYIEFVLKAVGEEALSKIKKSNFKVLADPNGGSGINILPELFKALGVEGRIVNDKLGNFGRLVEPKADSLTPLAEKMKSGEFEFACGFDCDGDRVEFVVPSESNFAKKMATPVVSGHYILALACDIQLDGTKNEVVVTNDATSYLVRDVIARHKATVKEVEVGETIVVREMEKNSSIIGGEGSCSGVIIPPIKCRDGIMSMALILKMLAQRGKSLLEVLGTYPEYYSDRTKLNCQPDKAVEVKNKIEEYFKENGYKTMKTGDETGGLKVLIDNNSFIFFRQSKTEPGAFRIHAEGDGKQKVKEMLNQGIEAFNKFKQ